jgi:hypothetical protein
MKMVDTPLQGLATLGAGYLGRCRLARPPTLTNPLPLLARLAWDGPLALRYDCINERFPGLTWDETLALDNSS